MRDFSPVRFYFTERFRSINPLSCQITQNFCVFVQENQSILINRTVTDESFNTGSFVGKIVAEFSCKLDIDAAARPNQIIMRMREGRL